MKIDLLTVSNQLGKDGKLEACGGDYYIIQLTKKYLLLRIEFHAELFFKYIQRSLIKISNEIIEILMMSRPMFSIY